MSIAPKVSVGLVVYNGEHYLREAMDSLLAQTFTDFELIISDNASTDSTPQICQEYAAKDQRIRYYRNNQNVGIPRNFNRVIELARGEYFKLAAHDDICQPDFLLRCVEVLDSDPTVVLCYTKIQLIDEAGQLMFDGVSDVNSLSADIPERHKRFYELIRHSNHFHQGIEVYGVIRMSALKQTPLFGYYTHGDRVLTARLGLLGRFHQVPENLFQYRFHPNQSTGPRKRGRLFNLTGPTPTLATWDPPRKDKIHFPEWRLNREYINAINSTDLSLGDRLLCYIHLGQRLFLHKNWARFGRDLLVATDKALEPLTEKRLKPQVICKEDS
jgi:glycosyltransferase involved in cell wall biosynthesis